MLKDRIYKTLRWSEKYTKTDMVYVAHGGSWLFVNQIIASATGFLITLILANLLPKETYGQYRFILTITPLLAIFTLPGVANAFTRAIARHDILDINRINKVRIKWGSVGLVTGILFSLYYFYNNNNTLGQLILLTSLLIPVYEIFLAYSYYLKGKENFRLSSIYESISKIVQMITILTTVFITQNILIIVLAYFLGKLITNYFFFKKVSLSEKFETNPEIYNIQAKINTDDVISYGKKLSLIGIIGTIAVNADKILVWHLLGDTELATYHVAITIPMTIILICNVVPRVAFPKLSRKSWNDEFKKLIARRLLFIFIFLSLIASLYVILIPHILPILFKSYESSVITAVIFAVLIPFSSINAIFAQIFRATKAVWDIIIMRTTFIISLSIIFYQTYNVLGINGAAIAMVVSEFIMMIIGFIFLGKIKEQESVETTGPTKEINQSI